MTEPDKTKKPASSSLGSKVLPKSIHQALQLQRAPINKFIRKEVFQFLKKDITVLDAGSGRIEEQHLREELTATGATLETLDMFAGEGVDHVGNVESMPFDDEKYDVVLCTQVLEHVENPRKVCEELYRVIKNGGHLALTAPQSGPMHNLPYHYFHFTKIGLKMILEEAGFTILKIEPQGGHFINLANQSHLTCRILKEHANSPLKKIILFPFEILHRLLYGFIFKALSLLLDRIFPYEGNTQGWNCLCIKDARK